MTIRSTLGMLAVLAWCAPSSVNAQVTYIDDALTAPPGGGVGPGVTAGSAGGSFGPSGWTTTGDTDTIWWVIPASLPRGRLEVTVSGLSTATSLVGQEHDLIAIYGPTDRGEPVSYNPWYRNNEFKAFVRVFGALNTCAGCQAVGASKLELALCPVISTLGYIETVCPQSCVDMGYDFWQAYLGPRGRDEPLAWDEATPYRFVITWEPGLMTYTRGGPEGTSTLGFPGTYAPSELRVRIGPPSSERGPDTAMPRGVTFSNVFVSGEPGAATASCFVPIVVPPDAGMPEPACVTQPISAVSLDPNSGTGPDRIFRATYRHCDGASAFRIAQLWVGDSVAVDVPHVEAAFEGGRFFLSGAVGSCAPGDLITLSGTYGALDCSRSTASFSGTDLVIDYALEFATIGFAGPHGVFFDAKGGTAVPEPRLGWTQMGTFTVAPAVDAGTSTMDAGSRADAGGRTTVPGGCGCRAATRADRFGIAAAFVVLLVLARKRARA